MSVRPCFMPLEAPTESADSRFPKAPVSRGLVAPARKAHLFWVLKNDSCVCDPAVCPGLCCR